MISPDKWYAPREIARFDEIINLVDAKSDPGRYNYVLRLIKTKELPARNIASITSLLPHYKVRGQDLITFLQSPT